MIYKILVVAGFLLLGISESTSAQTATLSPYSRFGPGEIVFSGFAHQQAMGGTSIADFGTGRLNFTNPATYSYDTLMVFEFGVMGEYGQMAQGNQRKVKQNASLSYISFGLPVVRDRVGLSFGVIPYSATGYDMQSTRALDSSGNYTSSFQGNGGYNRFYLGTGVKITKNLSAGVNASYLYGTVNQTSRIEFDNILFFDTRYKEEERLKDFYYEFGLHWQQPLRNDYRIAIGVTGAPSLDLDSRSTIEWVNYANGSAGDVVRDTVLAITDQKTTTTIPQFLGVGISLAKGTKWVVLADGTMQDWSKYKSSLGTDSLQNSFRVSLGGAYTPDDKGVSMAKRIQYRMGLYYHRTFLDLRNTRLNDQGITLGVGLPLRKAYQSMINFTVQAGQRGTLENNLVREQYLRLQFGVTLNEDWFRRRRYD